MKKKPSRSVTREAKAFARADAQSELSLPGSRPGRPSLEWEARLGYPEEAVAGVDEAGRGCLAGPVVAAAVVLPDRIDWASDSWLREVTDSKKVTQEKREHLFGRISSWAKAFAIAEATPGEIDEINILYASHLAMARAVDRLPFRPARVLIDGHICPKQFLENGRAVIKGDLHCLSVACASILAKVHRDRLMAEIEKQYPGYGFSGHKGYPTPAHVKALRLLGPTPVHRLTFGPVAALLGVAGASSRA